MNRVRNGQKFILISLVVILVSLTLSAPVSAAASPSIGWLSLWYSRIGCAYTYTV